MPIDLVKLKKNRVIRAKTGFIMGGNITIYQDALLQKTQCLFMLEETHASVTQAIMVI